MENILNDDKPQILFAQGLYGFEAYTKFTLLDSECDPFMWLQSEQENSLAFLVVDPFLYFPNYEIDVDDESLKELGIIDPKDVYILSVVTISKTKPLVITANLQGPIVINKKNNKARQVVLVDSKWRTKHDLLVANSKEGNPPC